MSQPDQKPTVEQKQFAEKLFEECIDCEGCLLESAAARLIAARDVTRDLAVEGAAIERVANACNESDGWDMHPKDYYKLVRRLITPAHITALEAHDREREDRMLKRFEELAGKWQKLGDDSRSVMYTGKAKDQPTPAGAAYLVISEETISLIASIRKERSDA